MKHLTRLLTLKTFVTLLIFNFIQLTVWGQETEGSSSSTSSTKTTITTTEQTDFWTSPWVWVIGAAVFILLLVALLRGGSSRTTAGASDRVTVTKTVQRDTDTDI
jgi:quinol-cytochrome oxidoreductase complex cytochrome b subunit